MLDTKSQNSNMLLAFLTLTGVIAIVALVGFFMLRKGPEIVQGQAEVTEYRVSSKVPGRILEFRGLSSRHFGTKQKRYYICSGAHATGRYIGRQ